MRFHEGTILQALKLATEKRLISLDEVIAWADRLIANDLAFGTVIIDLSLSKNSGVNHALACLNKWNNYQRDSAIVRDVILGLIRINFDKKWLTLRRAAFEIEEIFIEFEGKNYLDLWGMSLDDIYFLKWK